MQLLQQLALYVDSKKCAYHNPSKENGTLTYQQLLEQAEKLAYCLQEKLQDDKTPIVVYGHKDPMMLVYFLACVKSGRAYCPIDVNVPLERVKETIAIVGTKLVLATEALEGVDIEVLSSDQAVQLIATQQQRIAPEYAVKEDELFYILFTSGSTGKPKGVCVTYGNLNRFLDWFTSYYPNRQDLVFLGFPPFSFDLSVMSLYPAIALHGTLVEIDKDVQQNYQALFTTLQQSNATTWISTPSFADACLLDPSFNESLLPKVEQFIFCGERLFSKTVAGLHKAFPNAEVINTYGPTESTVMVTWISITKELNEKYAANLPVGHIRPNSYVWLEEEGIPVSKGEIMIAGDTVAAGYFHNEEKTQQSFFEIEYKGVRTPAYRTGDIGYYEGDLLFCEGRIDFQVKLNGFRIELEDVDHNLLKQSHVQQAVTLPHIVDGKVKSLTSYVVYNGVIENRFATVKAIKQALKLHLPDYMIPKKIVFLEQMPVTNNNKIDRKALQEWNG